MPRLRFGPSIKKTRVRLGITQAELGQKLNPKVGPGTVSHWETEYSYPSGEQKAQVREILGQISDENEARGEAEDGDQESPESPSAIGTWLNKHRLKQGFSVPELAHKAGLSAVAVYAIESGRSQNPQRKTVAKLEQALGIQLSPEAKKEAKDEATIEGVGEWFNFDPHSQSDWPVEAGIYVLYDISDRPIYVGQGQDISKRLGDHSDRFWFKQPIVQNAKTRPTWQSKTRSCGNKSRKYLLSF